MEYLTYYDSCLGRMFLLTDGTHLTRVDFIAAKYAPKNWAQYTSNKDLEIFTKAKVWLDAYFAQEIPAMPPFKITGNYFSNDGLE
ncbi:MAG: hypothetical protein MR210_08350 [Erysipelotrichaceae bacterium]|nr:hypothetical protein [Erysipelotrichaceae bacterium]MDY5251229.1 hypothetical protein [Erysipelotrichaceae bacterium]